MHVEDGFWQKVHYNALFGGQKREENSQRRDAEARRKPREPGKDTIVADRRSTADTLKGSSTSSKYPAKFFICITIDHRSL